MKAFIGAMNMNWDNASQGRADAGGGAARDPDCGDGGQAFKLEVCWESLAAALLRIAKPRCNPPPGLLLIVLTSSSFLLRLQTLWTTTLVSCPGRWWALPVNALPAGTPGMVAPGLKTAPSGV